MKKQLLSMLLAVSIVLSLISVPVMATQPEIQASGTCGENLTWTLTNDGTLTISGEGYMNSFLSVRPSWYEQREDIHEVYIEEGVTSIGEYAFYLCSNLESIEMPSSVSYIGTGAFLSCGSLVNVKIPEDVTIINGNTFKNCSRLNSVMIPVGVHTIDNYAFASCISLNNIVLPSTLTSIGHRAFTGCTSLRNVVIPEGVQNIGTGAFSSCSDLQEIIVSEENTCFTSIDGVLFDNKLKSLIQYPIGRETRRYEIPVGVESIGEFAFGYCDYLVRVDVPASLRNIEYGAFRECDNLESIQLKGIQTIGEEAFLHCDKLATLEIGASVKSIGIRAFSTCGSLKNVHISGNDVVIKDWAFYDCDSLESAEIGDGVTNIGAWAFSYNEKLKSVMISDSIKVISEYAFRECVGLTDVYFKGTKEQWNKISIYTWNEWLTSARIHYKNEFIPGNESQMLPALSEESARQFLGFVYNSSGYKNTDLSENRVYSLLCGKSSGSAIADYYKALAFLITMQGSFEQYISESNFLKETLREGLIASLSAELEMNAEYVGSLVLEECAGALEDIQDSEGDGLFSNEVLDEYRKTFDPPSYGAVDLATSLIQHSANLLRGGLLPIQEEMAGRYTYFNQYIENRAFYEKDSIAFDTIMDQCALAQAENNFFGWFITLLPKKASWVEQRELIDEWAEYTYQLLRYVNAGEPEVFVTDYSTIKVQCPIDVQIVDTDGNLVAETVDNVIVEDVPQELANKVQLCVFGDAKIITMQNDENYKLELVANGDGEFNYTCHSVGADGSQIKQANTYEIPIQTGDSFAVNPQETMEYTVVHSVETDTGELSAIPISRTTDEGKIPLVTISVDSTEEAGVFGSGEYEEGSIVKLIAEPIQGKTFVGWEENGVIVESDMSYTFTALKDRELVATYLTMSLSYEGEDDDTVICIVQNVMDNANLIFAFYDTNNRFCQISQEPAVNGTTTVKIPDGAASVSVFLLDEDWKPLTEKQSLSLEKTG